MTATIDVRVFRQPTSKLPAPPSRVETLDGLLDTTGRGIVPIRREFVQQGHGVSTTPGPLAGLLTAHDERGLDAYLLLHALASASPYNCSLPAPAWARALGIGGKPASAVGAVSKTMRRLDEDHNLVARGRVKRRAVLTLLREDGSREDYVHPSKARERYFRLPDTYWRDGWMTKLSLVGKTMLLVALERPDDFEMPFERASGWYGLSADSVERGLRELHNHALLEIHHAWVPDARSDSGWSPRFTYTLTGPFSKLAQQEAAGRRGKAEAAVLTLAGESEATEATTDELVAGVPGETDAR